MITWLIGENSFEVREALKALEAQFNGAPEYIDGKELTLTGLPELLMGVSLFSTDRLVIITDISQNGPLWEKLPDWLERVSDSIHAVFVDAKPDKRTAGYKALKSVAELHEYPIWTDKDISKAETWVHQRAQKMGVPLDKKAVKHLVQRVGVDQWQLAQALDMLALVEAPTIETIDVIISPNPQENIFQLFETALEGRRFRVVEELRTLSLQEDPYALFALLSSQALTLAAVTYAGENDAPLKDFAIHPFVASKLTRHSKKLGKKKVGAIVRAFADTDADIKRSKAEPWILIERLLLKIVD